MQTPAELIESEQYQLDRQATACRKAGDWPGAIAALQKRKALLGVLYDDDKLAKYLQAAGQLDDALAEIQWLVDNSHARASAMFGHQPATVRLLQHTIHMAQVYDAAALICKRAKRPELMGQYDAQGEQYRALRERLDPVAKGDQKVRSDEADRREAEILAKVGLMRGRSEITVTVRLGA